MRKYLKLAVEGLLSGSGLVGVRRRLRRGRGIVLTYHNVLPDGERATGDRSLHLARARFLQQLDRLDQTHQVVGLEALLERPYDPEATRPLAAITFDDAYRGSVNVGLPALAERGWPATIFVAPELLGDRAFWWDLLADPTTGETNPLARRRALNVHRGKQSEVVRNLLPAGRGEADLPAHSRSVTIEELGRAAVDFDVSFGVHTWSHANLTRLEDDEVADELDRPLAWLGDRFPRTLPWLAYPYGLRSARVERILQGRLAGALTLEGSFVPPRIDADATSRVPRVNVPSGVSPRGFDLRAAGILS